MGFDALPVPHGHGASGRGKEHGYARRRPEESVLYGVIQTELATVLARAQAGERHRGVLVRDVLFSVAVVYVGGEQLARAFLARPLVEAAIT